MSFLSRSRRPAVRHPLLRVFGVAVVSLAAVLGGGEAASAHPLGNFTTNTATQVTVSPTGADLLYVVDLAEIPALKARQEIGAPTGVVPAAAATRWRRTECASIATGMRLARNGMGVELVATGSTVAFPIGQAGLTTLRLECRFESAWTRGAVADFVIVDQNFKDRLGWREITVLGSGLAVVDAGDDESIVSSSSPSNLLRTYPDGAVAAPLDQRSAAFATKIGSSAPEAASSGTSPGSTNRGNDGLTQRFQSLLDEKTITLPFAVGAMLIAVLLGGLHAMAPGHGKTLMAAYAVSRRGTRGDILAIGATVAATHTIGIMILGALVSATTVVSPDRTLRWASVVSGVLVLGVGITLVRSRLRSMGRLGGDHSHDHAHPHPHGDHGHDDPHPHGDRGHDHAHPHGDRGHDHAHPHGDDGHDHAHPHGDHGHDFADAGEDSLVRAHPSDPRFVVTSHAHGGWSHDHVLPAPGANVRKRELIAMGLAGGLVPSPSALVVLLAAIALGRVPFGIALVMAYGVGLALTLVAAGVLLVRFESGIRQWAGRLNTPARARVAVVTNALPLVSGVAIGGAGILLLVRSVGQL